MVRPYALIASLWAAAIFVFSTRPEAPPGWELFPHQDKAFHFFAYAVLMLLIYKVFLHSPHRALTPYTVFLAALISIGYGTALEFYQWYLPGRECSIADFLANCGGVGALALCLRGRDG